MKRDTPHLQLLDGTPDPALDLERHLRARAAALPHDDDVVARALVGALARWQPVAPAPPARAWGRHALAAGFALLFVSTSAYAVIQVTRYVRAPAPAAQPPTRPPARPATETKAIAPAPPEARAPAPAALAPAPSRAPVTAATFMEQAARARQRGDLATAAGLYRKMQARFPRSREALVSHVSLGRLYLQSLGRPAAALAEFEAHLHGGEGAPLREQALAGKAQALEALGRDAHAAQVWQTLLREYPHTLYETHARRQLEAR